MKRLFRNFKKSEDGVVSVEFALIAPMLIFATLFSINLGYSVNKHQKLASSIAAGSNYIQDYVATKDMTALRPSYDSETGEISDTQLLSTTKQVIQSAYGEGLDLSEIYINTYCACPTNGNISDGETTVDGFETQVEGGTTDPNSNSEFDFTDSSKSYYTKTQMSLWKKGVLCDFECPNQQGKSRVIMDIEIYHTMTDLFGKRTVVKEKLSTRVR